MATSCFGSRELAYNKRYRVALKMIVSEAVVIVFPVLAHDSSQAREVVAFSVHPM
jgi:hypothetical protein